MGYSTVDLAKKPDYSNITVSSKSIPSSLIDLRLVKQNKLPPPG
jgi:hypothetical protein